MKNYSDPISVILALGVALNTVMIMNSIVTESHVMAIVNFLSGLFLIVAYENRRNKNDKAARKTFGSTRSLNSARICFLSSCSILISFSIFM